MTHPAYLLARLNPKTVRHDVGSGGLPELTPADIAAALAFVPAGLGREMVCRVWWPDGAQLTARDLDQLLMEAQLAEWRGRADRMLDAQLAQAAASTRSEVDRAERLYEAARERMWPRLGAESCYAAVRRAVLQEISSAMRCPVCAGRAFVMRQEALAACQACEATGHQKVSDRTRAELIGKDQAAYRRHYAPVYEWTYDLCQEAMAPALAQFRRAIQ